MNNKGQALVEFVIILPIFMMLLFIVIDFGIIFNTKINLENNSDDIITLINNGKDISDINDMYDDIDINISNYHDNLIKVSISHDIDIITPGLDTILGNPYVVSVERVISND